MPAVNDQFFGDDEDEISDGGDASDDSGDDTSNEDTETANADEDEGTETAETKGDTSKAAEPPTADAGKAKPGKTQRHVPLKAHEAERRKRQEAERRAQEAEEKLKSRGSETPPADKPKELSRDDAVVDPAAYTDQEVRKVEHKYRVKHYNASEARARAKVVDSEGKQDEEAFQKYHDAFVEAANADRRLFAAMDEHDDPVVFAIETGRKYLKAKDMGDPEEYEAKIRAEERAKVLAELKRKEPLDKADDIPPSNAGARAAADVGADGGDDEGDSDDGESFSSMLGRSKKR